MDESTLEKRISDLEDRVALKNLVDTFSNFADQMQIETQALLFTEDADCETCIDGQIVMSLKGRKQISEEFALFLKSFEVVYHINGQHTVNLNGDRASGISYTNMVLVSIKDGKMDKNSIGITYEDNYIKENGQWLIARRKGTFAWQEKAAGWGQ